jgi:GWxTD domain-containing protein
MTMRKAAAIVSVIISISVSAATSPQRKTASILNWGDSPQGYLMTSNERGEWALVHSEEGANTFVQNYWAKHGAAFRAEVMRRIAAADKYFPLGEKKGSETERGRVFIVLGAPNRQRSDRNDKVSPTLSGGGAMNSIEQRAFMTATWIYKPDRLPKVLNVSELTITFQIDVNRGYDTIENPGLIEPYLSRAADYFVANFAQADSRATVSPAPPANARTATVLVPSDDALWAADNALNGAIFTGQPSLSPTEKPFYAVDFYLPKAQFAPVTDVIIAGVIRDASGKQVASVRTGAKTAEYDPNGDRFVDASFELPAGSYNGTFALATPAGKILSVSRRAFTLAPEQVGMSDLLMTSRIDTLDKQQPFDPFTFIATKYNVKGDRRFRTSDSIAYFASVFSPSSDQPSVTLKMRVSRNGNVVDNGVWMPIDLAQTGPHSYLLATKFDPKTFQPGHYLLEVQLRDLKASRTSDAFLKGYAARTEFDVVE